MNTVWRIVQILVRMFFIIITLLVLLLLLYRYVLFPNDSIYFAGGCFVRESKYGWPITFYTVVRECFTCCEPRVTYPIKTLNLGSLIFDVAYLFSALYFIRTCFKSIQDKKSKRNTNKSIETSSLPSKLWCY